MQAQAPSESERRLPWRLLGCCQGTQLKLPFDGIE